MKRFTTVYCFSQHRFHSEQGVFHIRDARMHAALKKHLKPRFPMGLQEVN